MTKRKAIVSVCGIALCGIMAFGMLPLTACSSSKDSIVIMTEELSGNFSPFYATSGTDQDVIGYTQVSMLATDEEGNIACGEDYDTVVLDYDVTENKSNDTTSYTFVLKNGLRFSDGYALTMNDVMFNIYEYLDPVYTGSSTMYSTDIVGLSQYRTQEDYSSSSDFDNVESERQQLANLYAKNRVAELIDVFESVNLGTSASPLYSADESEMASRIAGWDVTISYMEAVGIDPDSSSALTEARTQLQKDYDYTLETFMDELKADYIAAKESYDTDTESSAYYPYRDQITDNFKFFMYEGYITPKYEQVNGRDNLEKIESFEGTDILTYYTTEEEAINRVYSDKVVDELNSVLTYWGTAGTVKTQYAADALDIIIHESLQDGELAYPNISGIESLGHTGSETSVTINGKSYTVARSHNSDTSSLNYGAPTDGGYDVLRITINGVDPKAIYNFSFSVAPVHYYTADSEHPNGRYVDIMNNSFGVEYASSSFQGSDTLQSSEHVSVPVGAGPYQATDRNDSDHPSETGFWSSNIVYYKRNENFEFEVQAERMRLQVVSSTDALDALQKKEVDFVTPQFTKNNSERLSSMEKKGFKQLSAWQLGYGYIGINAGKVPDVNLRRAIMCAMDTSLSLNYYAQGTVETIDWPMSKVCWAYPYEEDHVTSKNNGHSYTQFTSDEAAIANIQYYMSEAGVQPGDSSLKLTFTIAGASITEHPTYATFLHASELLNECGWNIEVKADSQALTKLSTGSLAVWAAAWGSTIDPDMYQVYHINSTASSTYAWGYREIKEDTVTYAYEYDIIKTMSEYIDDARETNDQEERTELYEIAMGYVLDLAVELPVYQRMTLYAYNTKTLGGLNDDVNPYSSPLERIWEIYLK